MKNLCRGFLTRLACETLNIEPLAAKFLCNLHEDNHERKQYQRFDKSQAQNQRELDERTRRRIASHSFASRRAYLTLACAASPAAIAIAKPAVMATQFVAGTALPPV